MRKTTSLLKNTILSSCGFSLIEILVVVTALILISGFGFGTLMLTQRRQAVDQSALDIKLFIERAKYNTISHVKPSNLPAQCTQAATAYELNITSTQVVMNAQCKSSADSTIYTVEYERKVFPTQMTVTRNGCLKFAFDVATNTVACTNSGETLPSIITISRPEGGYQKTLNIDTSGNVTIN